MHSFTVGVKEWLHISHDSATFGCMEVRFKDDSLDRLEKEKDDGSRPAAVVKAYLRLVQRIRSAPDERVFRTMGSLRFKKLKGKRKGQWSMRLNDQWRLILEFEGQGADRVVWIVEIADYH